MVVFDATTLLVLLRPKDVGIPRDPSTNKPISRCEERVKYLVERLDKARARIGIPTPVVAEAFVRSGSVASQIITDINNAAVFKILDFDTMAALELAAMTASYLKNGNKKGDSKDPWQKIKLDRQIVAISKCANATEIFTDDANLANTAMLYNIKATGFANLPLPPVGPQGALDFDAIGTSDEGAKGSSQAEPAPRKDNGDGQEPVRQVP